MTFAGVWCLLAVLQSPASDSLRLLAVSVSPSALVLEVRARSLAVRDAVNESLRRGELDAAGKIAAAYAIAWRDSFLVREVARFAAWPAVRQSAKVAVDSMRRAGIKAFGADGPHAAVVVWQRALRRATTNGDSAGMAALLGNIGAGLLEDGQVDSASVYLERARALAAAVGDLRVEANAVGALAGTREERGDLATAREYYARSLTLRDRIGDTRGTAADHNNLGLLAERLGDVDEAQRHFDTALVLNRRGGRDEVAATNLINLAGLASLAGDFSRAETLYRDALATWRADAVPRRARDLAGARVMGRRRGRAARTRPARAAPRRLPGRAHRAAGGARDLRTHRTRGRRAGRAARSRRGARGDR